MKKETLRDLLQKYLDGTLSDPENISLSAFMKDEVNKEMVTEVLTQLSLQYPASDDFNESRFMPLLTAIFNADKPLIKQQAKLYSIPAWRKGIYWAAASVLILMGTFIYIRYNVQKEPVNIARNAKASHPDKDIVPGGNRAVLTLANGSEIILDSAANGTVAAQGTIRISKVKEGELIYRPMAQNNNAIAFNTLTTPRGGQYQLTLSDGTQIWLNAASSITYPTVFTGSRRNVSITGEVYFKVATDKSRPFQINVGNRMNVDVLGTEFNIKAYSDDQTIRTTLLAGSVRIGHNKSLQTLSPGQQAQVANDGDGTIKVVDQADLEQAFAWRNGIFFFKGDDITAVMKQIERWYDVQVIFDHHPGFHFTGKIPRQSNVSSILSTIAITEAVRFKIDGKTIKVE